MGSAVAMAAAIDETSASIHAETTNAKDITARLAALEKEASLLATVPKLEQAFVPFGDYETEKAIIASGKFHPVFLAGPSGCGKTMVIRQICAELKREYIRVPVTIETDEDDLLGGFRLRNGETVFELGPVPVAMLRGAVLLLDEIDKGQGKLMCLQPVLEGQPLLLKKIGITISPKSGFNIISTANTKGQGDETGRFITSQILDEAFLERFPNTIEAQYPPVDVETEILKKTFVMAGGELTKSTQAFCGTLAKWAENIRAAAKAEASDGNTMSTRRLCQIVVTFVVLGTKNKQNQAKALLLCLNRFDDKTKKSFLDLYNKHVNDDGTPSNVGSANKPANW